MNTGRAVLGVDIGTSSSKGVVVSIDGRPAATATRVHEGHVRRPHPGHVEIDAELWWDEFVAIAGELVAGTDAEIVAVGVSGMGPCTLLADGDGDPVRPAILYGVDTRAAAEIAALTARYGAEEIVARCGSALSSQAVGPKLAWLAEHDAAAFARARKLLMPSSLLVRRLTGEYALDHHSASQAVPLYDARTNQWHLDTWNDLAGAIEPPPLAWSDEIVGTVSTPAAIETGLPPGIPVTTGTVDAWAEAVSVDAHHPGDLMLMYGTTMFLINTVAEPLSAPPLWGTVGVRKGSHNLAGGMATSGAITTWLKQLAGGAVDYGELTAAAETSGPGANGLVLLPYFAGERTPIDDPDARGVIAGLTLSHTTGDLYRAALEATAMGVRHNLEAFAAAGAAIDRVAAVGGGVAASVWTHVVSDITGRRQEVHRHSIGASYGSARLAADATGIDTEAWNPTDRVVEPRAELADAYGELYSIYRRLDTATRGIAHELAARQTTAIALTKG